MASKRRDVYKAKPMTEGKMAVIQGLLNEYDIQSAEDIQDALKDLLCLMLQSSYSHYPSYTIQTKIRIPWSFQSIDIRIIP